MSYTVEGITVEELSVEEVTASQHEEPPVTLELVPGDNYVWFGAFGTWEKPND